MFWEKSGWTFDEWLTPLGTMFGVAEVQTRTQVDLVIPKHRGVKVFEAGGWADGFAEATATEGWALAGAEEPHVLGAEGWVDGAEAVPGVTVKPNSEVVRTTRTEIIPMVSQRK